MTDNQEGSDMLVVAAFNEEKMLYQMYVRTSDQESYILRLPIKRWHDMYIQCAAYQWAVNIGWKEGSAEIVTLLFSNIEHDVKGLRRKYFPTALDYLKAAIERLFKWKNQQSM